MQSAPRTWAPTSNTRGRRRPARRLLDGDCVRRRADTARQMQRTAAEEHLVDAVLGTIGGKICAATTTPQSQRPSWPMRTLWRKRNGPGAPCGGHTSSPTLSASGRRDVVVPEIATHLLVLCEAGGREVSGNSTSYRRRLVEVPLGKAHSDQHDVTRLDSTSERSRARSRSATRFRRGSRIERSALIGEGPRDVEARARLT